MASWIETAIPDVTCFCSSRPADLVPGTEWLKEIFEKSTSSDLCLLMLSPDSALNLWVHFEAGLSLGAKISNKAVPVLYGGITPTTMPSTIRHLQALDLKSQPSFASFVSTRFLNRKSPKEDQTHASFINNLSEAALRLLKFGRLGLLEAENIKTQTIDQVTLSPDDSEIVVPRVADEGHVVSVRAEIIPRRQGSFEHWKFGIKLRTSPDQNNNDRLFQFHAGCHQGLKSWTIYFSQIPQVPINHPARLDNETLCSLQVWLTRDGWRIGCIGIDSFGNRTLLQTDRSDDLWRLSSNIWSDIIVSGWADGGPFQIDIQRLEIDRKP